MQGLEDRQFELRLRQAAYRNRDAKNIAIWMLGAALKWNSKNMMFPHRPEANQYLHT